MARIPRIAESEHPELTDLIAAVRGQRGRVSDLYATLLNSPDVAAGWLKFFTAVRQKAKLPARYRELVILRIALVNRAPYEFKAHRHHGAAAGLSEQQLDGLTEWRTPGLFDERDRAVLEYCDTMTTKIEVPEATFQGVRGLFDDRELVELTATIAGYNLVSRFLVALQVGQPGTA
jgi:AhpD family alkylhydroperoxidase